MSWRLKILQWQEVSWYRIIQWCYWWKHQQHLQIGDKWSVTEETRLTPWFLAEQMETWSGCWLGWGKLGKVWCIFGGGETYFKSVKVGTMFRALRTKWDHLEERGEGSRNQKTELWSTLRDQGHATDPTKETEKEQPMNWNKNQKEMVSRSPFISAVSIGDDTESRLCKCLKFCWGEFGISSHREM